MLKFCKDGRIQGQNNKGTGNHLGTLVGTHSGPYYIKKGKNPNQSAWLDV